jgi:phage terminase large subunit-like protein
VSSEPTAEAPRHKLAIPYRYDEKSVREALSKAGYEDVEEILEHPAHQYAVRVLEGELVTCRYVQLAAKRYVEDLLHGAERGIRFDREAAEVKLEFYQFCNHYEGEWAGTPIDPSDWQQFIDWNVFGWKREDGLRRFRIVYEEVARKAGKSTRLASTGIYLFRYDDEPGAQVYTVATKKDQAIIIHRSSTAMVQKSPELQGDIKVFRNNLFDDVETNSFFRPLGSDSRTEDGLNVHAALIDEYHAHPDDGMYRQMRSAMGARRQPLLYIITTAGYDSNCPCFQEREYAVGLLEGRFQNDAYFSIVYTLDEGDDWQDERVWVKSNPNIGISPKWDEMRLQAKTATEKPSEQNEFKTKRLNIWTEAVSVWIPVEKWKENRASFDPAELAGARCYAAIDLSSTLDTTAKVLCFPPVPGKWERYRLLVRFYIPDANLLERSRRDKVPYDQWVAAGYVTATDGATVDYDYIQADILEDCKRYDVREISYDPHNASQFITNLIKVGLEQRLIEFPQSWQHISPAAKDFEKKVLDGQVEYLENPAMEWQISCTSIKSDPNGNIHPVKPDRLKSSKRIDGPVTAIMACDRAVRNSEGKSIYEARGVTVV